MSGNRKEVTVLDSVTGAVLYRETSVLIGFRPRRAL